MGFQGGRIEWLDFKFKHGDKWPDAELKGLEFIEDSRIQQKWAIFWPVGGGIHNWDAVGLINPGEDQEFLLLEAKAHIQEIKSDCKAKDTGSIKKIRKAFEVVKKALGVSHDRDWMKGYYQSTNRIASLYFLHQQKISSHLLFIYFIGDRRGSKRDSPQSIKEWQQALKTQEEYIGLPKGHLLEGRIHKLFLIVDRQ